MQLDRPGGNSIDILLQVVFDAESGQKALEMAWT